jgi:chromodomain-helicase-DNA-binding protein 7
LLTGAGRAWRPSSQFLCNGLEEDMTARWAAAHSAAAAAGACKDVEGITRASGKMLLLHKLLPKLRAEGRQVSSTAVLQGC